MSKIITLLSNIKKVKVRIKKANNQDDKLIAKYLLGRLRKSLIESVKINK